MLFGTKPYERASDKFHLVEEFIAFYLTGQGGLQDPNKEAANQFMVDIIEVVNLLLKFGFYATYPEVKELTACLADTLDGSNDFSSAEKYAGKGVDDGKKKYADDGIRFKLDTPGNTTVMSSKQAIINCLVQVSLVRDAYRQDVIMAYFKSAERKLGSSHDDSKALYFEDKKKDNELTLTKAFEDKVVDVFESSDDKSGIDGDLLDIDKGLSPVSNLPAICMDLMMYDSPELFESAFTLMWSEFAQREPVIHALERVILLKSPRLYSDEHPLKVRWPAPTDPTSSSSSNSGGGDGAALLRALDTMEQGGSGVGWVIEDDR
jgi:hypothetical protein